jgi:hypothetical protein
MWPWRSAEKLWAETEREWKLGMRDNCRLDIFQNCIVDFYGRYLTGDPSRHANGQFEKLRKLLAEESTRNAN